MLFLAVKVNVSFQAQSQLSIHVLHQKLHTLPMLHFQCSHFALDPRVLRSAQARTLLCHGSCIVLCHCSVDIHMCHMQGPHVLPPVFTERRARSTNCLSKAWPAVQAVCMPKFSPLGCPVFEILADVTFVTDGPTYTLTARII